MPIMQTMRRLFARRTPIEMSVQRKHHPRLDHQVLLEDGDQPDDLLTPATGGTTELAASNEDAPTEAPAAILTRIDDAMQEGRDFSARLMESIDSLPESTNNALRTLAQRQDTLIELAREIADAERARGEAEQASARELTEVLGTHSETLGLVQRQLDANHQVAAATAERLEDMGRGLTESITTNRRTGEAMTALVGELRSTSAQQDARIGRLQGWMIACVIACLATVLASVTLAWVALAG